VRHAKRVEKGEGTVFISLTSHFYDFVAGIFQIQAPDVYVLGFPIKEKAKSFQKYIAYLLLQIRYVYYIPTGLQVEDLYNHGNLGRINPRHLVLATADTNLSRNVYFAKGSTFTGPDGRCTNPERAHNECLTGIGQIDYFAIYASILEGYSKS
jgi:hypothetical protein